jgi:hypothetical protein
MAQSDYDMAEYDITVNSLTCVGSPCGSGVGSGDSIEIDGSGVGDANFILSTTIDPSLDTGPTPDEIELEIILNSVNASHIDETAAYTWTGASTHANATVDGVDAGSSATRTSEAKIRIASHNTDCTAITDGVSNEVCYEEDSETTWICRPSAGGCDTAAEWIPIGDVTRRVVDGTDFVGTITCPSTITGSTQGDCLAIVTTYKSQVFVGGFLVMAGNFIPSDPDNTSSYAGMMPLYAYFSPDRNFSSEGAGGDLDAFAIQLRTLAVAHFNSVQPRMVLAANAYLGDFDEPFIWRYGVLDVCNSARFFFSGNAEDTVVDEPETATLVGDTDPTSNDAIMLECPNCDFYGGDANPYDGDEKTLPGFHVCFDTTVEFTDPDKRCVRIRRIVDDDTIELADPQEDGYTGTIQYANGVAFTIDEGTTASSAVTENFNAPTILCSDRLSVECAGNCRSANSRHLDEDMVDSCVANDDPWLCCSGVGTGDCEQDPLLNTIDECTAADTPYDCCTGNGAGTCSTGYRNVPLHGVMIRATEASLSPWIIGFDGKWGAPLSVVANDGYEFTSTAGEFRGVINSFTSDETAFQFGRTGYEDGTDDDGRHCSIYLGVPMFDVIMNGGDLHPNLVCVPGANSGQITIDSSKSQNVQTRVWAPRGSQDINYIAGAREETMKCGAASFPPFDNECEDEFQALYELGPFSTDDFFTIFDFKNAGKAFTDAHIDRTVINFRDTPSTDVVVEVGGAYEYFTDLFGGDLGGGDAVVRGDISFRPASGAPATSYDPPAGDADLTGLVIRNESGEVEYDLSAPTTLRTPSGNAFPTSPSAGDMFLILDDSVAGACDSAGGTADTLCVYNGSVWMD